MNRFWQELKVAFAVTPDKAAIDEDVDDCLDRLAKAVVERGLTAPAMIFLESIRPLNFLASQSMIAAWPLVKLFAKTDDFQRLARALEHRETLARLAQRIEEIARQEEERK